MKIEQQQQARHLYFQTDLSKSEIANMIGVSRTSLHAWVREQEWDRLKKSAQHMPALVAENCYLIMAKLQESMLSELRFMKPPTPDEINMLSKLTLSIRRLTKRSALNESMELNNHLMEYVNREHPEMSEAIQPIINGFLKHRSKVQPHQFMSSKFNDEGRIPTPGTHPDIEKQLDLQDLMDWSENPPMDFGAESTDPSAQPIPPTPKSGSGATPSPEPALSNAEGERAGVRPNSTGEAILRQTTLANAETLLKNALKNITQNGKHLNRAQRRKLEQEAKANRKQHPKAA